MSTILSGGGEARLFRLASRAAGASTKARSVSRLIKVRREEIIRVLISDCGFRIAEKCGLTIRNPQSTMCLHTVTRVARQVVRHGGRTLHEA